MRLWIVPCLSSSLLLACGDKDTETNKNTETDTETDTGEVVDVDPQAACDTLGLPIRAYDATSPTGDRRRELAPDFSIPLRDGTEWTFSEQWSGCETYIFLPHWLPISDLDGDSWWTTDVSDLIERSPANVHYFLIPATTNADDAETYGVLAQDNVDEAIAGLSDDDAAWWSARLHVLAGELTDGLLMDIFSSNIGVYGFGIDREQRIRGLGSPAAVEAYSAQLSNQGYWPWERRLYAATNEPIYFNFEADRQARLDATEATVVEVFGGDVIDEYEDGTLSLPDAEAMAGFDTLEIDVLMECPDPESAELGNCGAWDYLAHMYLYDEASKSWLEMGRFITTYHRESRWVLDASHALAWLQDGGDRTIRYSWAPSWNTQPTGVTLQVRLSNQGKGVAPREIIPLFTGGSFSSTYNDREPVTAEIPVNAQKVELVSIITGHGMETSNCAEFCPHSHHFTVGAYEWEHTYDEASTETGCEDDVVNGTVPNQGGTWWFGRGGWCPGRKVDPFVIDVTEHVTAGAVSEVSYAGRLNGATPPDGSGNIVLSSWLVISY
ncbi:MAG: hypothetical protein ACI8S6_001312 [Myxococcota bacterium]|jgi:hypothetical protein